MPKCAKLSRLFWGEWRLVLSRNRRGEKMDKNETVALMAATIYAAGPTNQAPADAENLYHRAAAQAWALFDAVEREAADRYSRQ